MAQTRHYMSCWLMIRMCVCVYWCVLTPCIHVKYQFANNAVMMESIPEIPDITSDVWCNCEAKCG